MFPVTWRRGLGFGLVASLIDRKFNDGPGFTRNPRDASVSHRYISLFKIYAF